MAAKVLTVPSVERLKPDPAKRLEIPDAAMPGLYLVIQPSGAKSWAVRYRAGGRPRKMTLGPYPALDLAAGREQARKALQLVALGRDPGAELIQVRRQGLADPDRDLFKTAVDQFLGKARQAK